MEDDASYIYLPSLLKHLNSLLFVPRTRKSVFLYYAFIFSFILLALFLIFNPSSTHFSSSSKFWFTNIFYGVQITNQNVTSSSNASSTLSSQTPVHNSTHLSSNPTSENTSKTQTLNSELNDKVGIFIPNFEFPKLNNHTQDQDLHDKSNITTPQSSVKVKNQTQYKDLIDRAAAITKLDPEEQSKTRNSSQGLAGSGDERIAEKGVHTNLTSLPKKEIKEAELMNCDFYDGEWVKDDSYPLYKPASCSLIDAQFNCFLNGRPDQEYQQYKWKPKACTLPRLEGRQMLELLRGQRIAFVGDSLNRNMWESLICILKNSVKDQSKVYEASGRHQFRSGSSFSFIFEEYDFSLEFFVSPFLVQEGQVKEKNGSRHETLRIDKMWMLADIYKTADILIFNTGHWWMHPKTSQGKNYYQEGTHVYGELHVMEAFRKALTTWSRWVDAHINPKKSLVLFRGYSATHFSGGQWNSGGKCDNQSEPTKDEKYLDQYPPMMEVVEQVLQNTKTPIVYMNITRLTDFRKDGHPSMYRKQHMSSKEKQLTFKFQDCSHWCLPGVPDIWNEILYAELLKKHYYQKQQQQQIYT